MKKWLFFYVIIHLVLFAEVPKWESLGLWDADSIAVDSRGQIFVTTSYKLLSTKDDGKNWLEHPLSPHYRGNVAVDHNDNIIFVGSDYIYVSFDRGQSWENTKHFSSISDSHITAQGEIYIGSQDGLYYSDDFGRNWSNIGSQLPNANIENINIQNKSSLYAVLKFSNINKQVYHSNNGGATWDEVSIPTKNVLSFGFSEHEIFLGTQREGLFKSQNGRDWQQVTNPIFEEATITSFKKSPDGRLFALGSRLFCLEQDGWRTVSFGCKDLCFDSQNRMLTAVGGVYRLDMNFSYLWKKNSLNNIGVGAICVQQNEIFAGTWGEEKAIYKSSDDGNTWKPVGINLQGRFTRTKDFEVNSKGDIFMAIWEGGLFRSQDRGESWQSINQVSGLKGVYFSDMAIDSADQIFATRHDIPARLFTSKDNGDNWISLYEKGKSNPIAGQSILILGNGRVLVATEFGIFLSTDNGSSWREVFKNSARINILRQNQRGEIFACDTYKNILKSSDGGETWVTLHKDFFETRDMLIAPDGGIFLIDRTIMYSSDNGENFDSINIGLDKNPNSYFNCITINSQGKILISSSQDGIFESTISFDKFAPNNFFGE